MNNTADTLGRAIKDARLAKKLTQKQLASRLDISVRYLMSIENNRQKPSYDLLFRIIRELAIPADSIFYPEFSNDKHDITELRMLLGQCGEKEIKLFKATLQLILENK